MAINMNALRTIAPIKANLLDDIFGYHLNNNAIPVLDRETGLLKPQIAPSDKEFNTYRKEVRDSLNASDGRYVGMEKVHISTLRAIKLACGDKPYYKARCKNPLVIVKKK